MVQKWDVMIPELTGEEKRNLYIYLPESYQQEPDRRYPVLYMFDGHNLFWDEDATYGKCWGLQEYLDKTETQLIVVGVECNHSPDHGRLKEYSPHDFQDAEFGKIAGKGRLTMEWYVNELKPEIDRAYRTIPDRSHTFLAGSSMGGLMSLYGLLVYNDVYSRAAALSPSLWTAPRKIDNMIKNARVSEGTVLYMDYGEWEMGYRRGMDKRLQRTAKMLTDKKILLTTRIVPGGTHCEASWEKQLPFMLGTLMYGIEG